MNIIKVLTKQKESGKTIVLTDGNIVSEEGIVKANMKEYLAGIKDGTIKPSTSLTEYSEQNSIEYLSIDDLISYIKDEKE